MEAIVDMKWKILNDNKKENGRKLAKYMNKIIYTRTTDYQEKKKMSNSDLCDNVKMMRTEAL